jgi:hypothetical protein
MVALAAELVVECHWALVQVLLVKEILGVREVPTPLAEVAVAAEQPR